jgi:hypothetical protein
MVRQNAPAASATNVGMVNLSVAPGALDGSDPLVP